MRITERKLRRIIRDIISESVGSQFPPLDVKEREMLGELILDIIDEFFRYRGKDLRKIRFLQDIKDKRVKFDLGEERTTASVFNLLERSYSKVMSDDWDHYENLGEKILNGEIDGEEMLKLVEKKIIETFPKLGEGRYNEFTPEYLAGKGQDFYTQPYWGFAEMCDKWNSLDDHLKFCDEIVDKLYSENDVMDV